jgi:hypothetical protein
MAAVCCFTVKNEANKIPPNRIIIIIGIVGIALILNYLYT